MSTGQATSPFRYTIDLTRVAFAAIIALSFLGFAYFASPRANRVPFAQPSVPALIAPACDGRCKFVRLARKPFNVVCPYCRNTLSAQPSATGDSVGTAVGAVAGAAK